MLTLRQSSFKIVDSIFAVGVTASASAELEIAKNRARSFMVKIGASETDVKSFDGRQTVADVINHLQYYLVVNYWHPDIGMLISDDFFEFYYHIVTNKTLLALDIPRHLEVEARIYRIDSDQAELARANGIVVTPTSSAYVAATFVGAPTEAEMLANLLGRQIATKLAVGENLVEHHTLLDAWKKEKDLGLNRISFNLVKPNEINLNVEY